MSPDQSWENTVAEAVRAVEEMERLNASQRGRSWALPVPEDVAGRIPAITSRQGWLEQVRAVLDSPRGQRVRRAHGVSRSRVVAVSVAMALYANSDNGRDLTASNEALARRAGVGARTVRRARHTLADLGMAVEVVRGRNRLSRLERTLAEAHHGGRQTKAASVWYLTSPQAAVSQAPRRRRSASLGPRARGSRVVRYPQRTGTGHLPSSRRVCRGSFVGKNSPTRAHARVAHHNNHPRPLHLQRAAAVLEQRIHGLPRNEHRHLDQHVGVLATAITAAGIDTTRYTGADILTCLDRDTAARGWSWPNHISNPHAFLTMRLSQIDWSPPSPTEHARHAAAAASRRRDDLRRARSSDHARASAEHRAAIRERFAREQQQRRAQARDGIPARQQAERSHHGHHPALGSWIVARVAGPTMVRPSAVNAVVDRRCRITDLGPHAPAPNAGAWNRPVSDRCLSSRSRILDTERSSAIVAQEIVDEVTMGQHRLPLRGIIRALTRATVATAVAATGLAAPATAIPAGCADTFNVMIPGTWETNDSADPARPVGLLAPVAEAITREHGDDAEVYTLPYMARAFDNGHTYADSKATAVTAATSVLRNYAQKCRGAAFTLTGYSQGADAAGDLASSIGNGQGPIAADRVLAVGLVADPGSGTDGESPVGPQTGDPGIADPRPQGMGSLSGKVASICAPEDLYCSADKGESPLLGTLGTILTDSPSGDDSNTNGGPPSVTIATDLASNFSNADLPGIGEAVHTLVTDLTSGTGSLDLPRIARSAHHVLDTLTPLADLAATGVAAAATGRLSTAPSGSPEHNANQVLTAAQRSELPTAIDQVTTIADTASNLMSSNTNNLPANTPEATQMAAGAPKLADQVAPLASTATDVLDSATSALSVLKPATLVDQALNVVTGITSIDLAGILTNLAELPAKVAALDAHGAHQIAGELNNQFAPLVKMAAHVDLQWISSILSIVPDPQGFTQIAAMVVSILSNVDIVGIANLVGQIQEVAWTAIEKLLPPPGHPPDPVGAGGVLTDLLPIGVELANIAAGMLTGTATKTPPELLGQQPHSPTSTTTNNNQSPDLHGLTDSLTTAAQTPDTGNITALVEEGLNAVDFLTSGAHQNYTDLTVDNAGRNTIEWLSDWINLQISHS